MHGLWVKWRICKIYFRILRGESWKRIQLVLKLHQDI